jgi:hypothetical protein
MGRTEPIEQKVEPGKKDSYPNAGWQPNSHEMSQPGQQEGSEHHFLIQRLEWHRQILPYSVALEAGSVPMRAKDPRDYQTRGQANNQKRQAAHE